MDILIYHPRQTGDVIMGTHCAKLLKKKHGDCNITFVTSEQLVDLIDGVPWIDLVVPEPQYNIKDLKFSFEKEPENQGEWFDAINIATFEKLKEEWMPDLAYRPWWNGNERDRPYVAPYIFRCFADKCDLTDEDIGSDFAYALASDIDARAEVSTKIFKTTGPNIVFHLDHLDKSFYDLAKEMHAHILDNSGTRTWRQNLEIMAAADLVVTRYGGVSIMAASVGTPTITIPKPEPPIWGAPNYSHPDDNHILLMPRYHCTDINGDHLHRRNPCSTAHAKWNISMCPLGLPTRGHIDAGDHFHCWRSITPTMVKEIIEELGSAKIIAKSMEAHRNWQERGCDL